MKGKCIKSLKSVQMEKMFSCGQELAPMLENFERMENMELKRNNAITHSKDMKNTSNTTSIRRMMAKAPQKLQDCRW